MKVGGWSNDLDKNNCAVIIIKTVLDTDGERESTTPFVLRFSNHLMQMVAILYALMSGGPPMPLPHRPTAHRVEL